MAASFRAHIRSVAQYNGRSFRQSPLAELSGSLGDLGTLLPLMIAMALKGSIDLGSTLVFSGLANIVTGVVFGIPLPVQPMKAIAAIAISQGFTREETTAAGLTMGFAVLMLSATGLLRALNHIVPVAVVKGIQVAAGLSLVISAGTSLLVPLRWTIPAYDNKAWAIAAFLFLVISTLVPRIPYALVIFLIGFVIAAIVGSRPTAGHELGLWKPSPSVPDRAAWRTGAIDAAIPQLPLTTLNSILAVTSLAATLFPDYPTAPTTTSLGFSVAFANIIGCWFGAMPVCHGSGGLAGQYRFGARSGASIIILGAVKLILGLFIGDAVVPLIQRFPKSLLGIMVLAAGVELAKAGQSLTAGRCFCEQVVDSEESQINMTSEDEWRIMLVTVAGCLAFKNDAVGFVAGMVWYWSLRLPTIMQSLLRANSPIQLLEEDRRDSHLLASDHEQ